MAYRKWSFEDSVDDEENDLLYNSSRIVEGPEELDHSMNASSGRNTSALRWLAPGDAANSDRGALAPAGKPGTRSLGRCRSTADLSGGPAELKEAAMKAQPKTYEEVCLPPPIVQGEGSSIFAPANRIAPGQMQPPPMPPPPANLRRLQKLPTPARAHAAAGAPQTAKTSGSAAAASSRAPFTEITNAPLLTIIHEAATRHRVGDCVFANMPQAISSEQDVPKNTCGRIVRENDDGSLAVEWQICGGRCVTNVNSDWVQSAPSMEQVEPQQATPPSSPSADQDPQLVRQYASDILRSMMQQELRFMPKPNYLQDQPQVNAKMRSILTDWLVEVHRKYTLRRETLFLAVNVTDRYLSHVRVSRDRLQLVGVTALMIASKFEEVEPPELRDFIYVTANTYSREDIIDMEISILSTLGFEIAGPTAAHFLEHFKSTEQRAARAAGRARDENSQPVPVARWAADLREDVHSDLAWYILELSLLEVRTLRRAPSHVAAAALLLSNRLSGVRRAWSSTLARQSGYVEKELESCAAELHEMLEAAPQNALQGVRNQYRHSEAL